MGTSTTASEFAYHIKDIVIVLERKDGEGNSELVEIRSEKLSDALRKAARYLPETER